MWTYKVSVGELWHDGKLVGRGYCGAPGFKNDPSKENLKNRGPLPRGKYTISPAIAVHKRLGPVAIPLVPDKNNKMFGRSDFLIHADSILHPGAASEGCIIMPYSTRVFVASSNDKELEVV